MINFNENHDEKGQFSEGGYGGVLKNPQRGTQEYKKWFSGSKVVDENGNPLAAYHGTESSFDEFSEKEIGSNEDPGFLASGFYFTSDSGVAEDYTGDSGKVLSVDLSIKNPFEYHVSDGEFSNETYSKLDKLGIKYEYPSAGNPARVVDPKSATEIFKKNGYDGVILYGDKNYREFVVFSPKQISIQGSVKNELMKKLFNFLWGSIEVVNSADGPSQMAIYDTIGKNDFSGGGISDVDFSQALKSANNMQDLHIHVNSKGGDVHHGMSMRNALKAWKQKTGRKVTTIIDGIAASTASWAFPTASDEVKAYKGSQVYVHEAMAVPGASSAGVLRDTADILDKTSDQIAQMYADKSGKPAKHWRGKMDKGTLMTGDEAKSEGLVDFIIDGNATNFGMWAEAVKQQLVVQNQMLNENPNHDELGRLTEGGGELSGDSKKAYDESAYAERMSARAEKSTNLPDGQHKEPHYQASLAHQKAAALHRAADDKLNPSRGAGHAAKVLYHEKKTVSHTERAFGKRVNQISSAPTQGAENLDTIKMILNFNPPEKSTFDLISSAVAGQ